MALALRRDATLTASTAPRNALRGSNLFDTAFVFAAPSCFDSCSFLLIRVNRDPPLSVDMVLSSAGT